MVPMSRPVRDRRPDESMSLLVDIATSALDPGYEQAARRRQADAAPAGHRGVLLLGLGVLATALLVAVAAAQTHAQRPANDRSRAALTAAVQARTKAVDALARRLADPPASTASLRAQAPGRPG